MRGNHPIDRLRAHRNAPARDASLAPLFGAEARRQKRAARAAAGVGGAWATIVPVDLAEGSAVVRCVRGVLTVRVRDASVKYRLHQWLGSGGLAELRRHSGLGLTRVAFLQG